MLVRTLTDIDPNALDTVLSEWRLIDSKGSAVKSGRLKYKYKTYGMQLWEADFSSYDIPGIYTMEFSLKMSLDRIIGNLATQPFRLEKNLLFNNVVKHLTIENAEARIAEEKDGYGYYDCNWSTMGEGYSHGIFLNSLAQTYLLRGGALTGAEKSRYIASASIAFDYLMLLQLPSGEIDHQYRKRPNYQGSSFGIMNTQEALYGMSAFLDIFKGIDHRANDENYTKILKTLEFAETAAPWGWKAGYDTYGEYLIPIYFHLYKYSGDVNLKAKAINKLNYLMNNLNVRTMWRSSFRAIPMFEGLKYCVDNFKDDPEYENWIAKAKFIKDNYFKPIITTNAFNVITTSTKANAISEWDDASGVPDGDPAISSWTWINSGASPAYCIDACILGDITGDSAMKQVAAGEINWILGLNPGVPRWTIRNPISNQNDRNAASFIGNLNARCVTQNYSAWTPKNNTFMSISNGFTIKNNTFWYENRWNESENFIKSDGSFVFASLIYEDYLG
ncbi:MAG: early set domain-containing protein [Saccharofermentanales bacterium]